MKVTVKLFGALREYLPTGSSFSSCELNLIENATIADLLGKLPLPENKAFLIIHNDEKVNSDAFATTEIEDRDEIVLLPPIKGG